MAFLRMDRQRVRAKQSERVKRDRNALAIWRAYDRGQLTWKEAKIKLIRLGYTDQRAGEILLGHLVPGA